MNEESKLATLEELLYFEPYYELGGQIITEVCSEYMKVSKITENLLGSQSSGRSGVFPPFSDDAHELLQLWQDRGEGTYQCLRRELDKFRILFAGKIPLPEKSPLERIVVQL